MNTKEDILAINFLSLFFSTTEVSGYVYMHPNYPFVIGLTIQLDSKTFGSLIDPIEFDQIGQFDYDPTAKNDHVHD